MQSAQSEPRKRRRPQTSIEKGIDVFPGHCLDKVASLAYRRSWKICFIQNGFLSGRYELAAFEGGAHDTSRKEHPSLCTAA